MKNGLFFEDNELIYYENGEPKHAGVIELDGAIYYISSKGRAIKGQHIVHGEMTNGLLKRGTYTFGDDYKLIKGSYIAPRKKSAIRKKKQRRTNARKSMPIKLTKILQKKQNWIALGCLLVFVVSFIILGNVANDEAILHPTTDEPGKNKVAVTLPSFDEDVLLCSETAKMEYDGDVSLVNAIKTGDPYRPFYFAYTLENASGQLYLGEQEDLSDAQEYKLTEGEEYICIDNLKVDTTYYYEVVVDGKVYPGSFQTAAANRFVSIPGLCNTRDIGGYVTKDGKKVKQGLLIRGVELDGLVNASFYIPNEELANVQDTFGFVYDMDLRLPSVYIGEYTSRLDVPHSFYSCPQYGEIFNEYNYDSLRRIFADFADPEKYPMYLHCTWGQDRTGTVVFLLQGLLNIAEEEMIREYRLTGYTFPDIVTSNKIDVVLNGLASFEGNTLQEKIVTFLKTEIGVTESEIVAIREIFLEG